MRYFKQVILLALAIVILSNGVALPQNPLDGFAEAIGKLVLQTTKYEAILFALCAQYFMKFNRWPSDKEEFKNYFLDTKNKTSEEETPVMKKFLKAEEGATKKSPEEYAKESFEALVFDFKNLPDGSLLIEGGLNLDEKTKEDIKKMNLGSIMNFSVIARRTETGFSFSPSEKAKKSTDFLKQVFN